MPTSDHYSEVLTNLQILTQFTEDFCWALSPTPNGFFVNNNLLQSFVKYFSKCICSLAVWWPLVYIHLSAAYWSMIFSFVGWGPAFTTMITSSFWPLGSGSLKAVASWYMITLWSRYFLTHDPVQTVVLRQCRARYFYKVAAALLYFRYWEK